MIALNIILLAFNLVLVPVSLMLGWLRGYDEGLEADTELYDAYAKLGKSVYENFIKEDDHE